MVINSPKPMVTLHFYYNKNIEFTFLVVCIKQLMSVRSRTSTENGLGLLMHNQIRWISVALMIAPPVT